MKTRDFMFSHNSAFYLASTFVGLSVSKGKKGGEMELILWILKPSGESQISL